MLKLLSLLLFFTCSECVTIQIYSGIIGPWRDYELKTTHITSSILKKGFISKIKFEEDEEIDEEDQIESVSNMAGLTEFEMKSVGQLKAPIFTNLRLIKIIKLSGNEITEINGEFGKIKPKSIDLAYNKIKKIEAASFGDGLETLILNCNQLEAISADWFQDPDSLQHLRITGNHIKIIPADFNSLTSLWELHASHNRILNIEDRAFSPARFTYLDFAYNNISNLKHSIFSTSKPVEVMYLNLRANRLNFLSEEFMKKVTVTVELTADLNPWLCPCNDRIRKWLPNVLYNNKNSWLDAQAFDHAHRKDTYCVKDLMESNECFFKIDTESTEYYFDNIEPLDVKGCIDY